MMQNSSNYTFASASFVSILFRMKLELRTNCGNFPWREVVDRGRETQLQVTEN